MPTRSRGKVTPEQASLASSLTFFVVPARNSSFHCCFGFFWFFYIAHKLITEVQKPYYMESKRTHLKYVGRIASSQTSTTFKQKEKASAVPWWTTHIQGPHIVTHNSLKNSSSSFFPCQCIQFCEKHWNTGGSPCWVSLLFSSSMEGTTYTKLTHLQQVKHICSKC